MKCLESTPVQTIIFQMERAVRKLHLHDEKIAPLIEDREEAMRVFWEILRRGAENYPRRGANRR
jgi:hypothetical protein